MIRYHLAILTTFLVGRIPPWFGYKIASLVGEVMYLTRPRARKGNIVNNLPDQWYPLRRLRV